MGSLFGVQFWPVFFSSKYVMYLICTPNKCPLLMPPCHLHLIWMFDVLFFSMDGFRVVRMEEVIKQVDILVTCTGV